MTKAKNKINKNELSDFIENLLGKFPPEKPKNLRKAYQEFVDTYPEKILSTQWAGIYKDGRGLTAIVNDILKAFKGPKIRVEPDFGIMGKGGQRGIAKEWREYILAASAVISPQTILKGKNLNVDPLNVFAAMRFEKLDSASEDIKIAASYFYWLFDWVLFKFIELYEPKNIKHFSAIKHFFGEESTFTIRTKEFLNEENIPITTKGKQLTSKSIDKSIEEVWNYMFKKDKRRKKEDFYKNKKFYFIVWLTSLINKIIELDYSCKKRIAIKQIRNILKPFNDKDKLSMLSTLPR